MFIPPHSRETIQSCLLNFLKNHQRWLWMTTEVRFRYLQSSKIPTAWLVGRVMSHVGPTVNTSFSDPPAMSQKSQKPLTMHKVSDPSTRVPIPRPIRPPSLWTEGSEYPERLNPLQFPEPFDELLRDEEWIDKLKMLPEGDVVGLIDHLNNVRLTAALTTPRSLPHRFLMASIARTRSSASVSTCCKKLAAPG